MRIARPAHPGQFIRMEVIEPLHLSVTRAAKALGVTRAALSALLDGRLRSRLTWPCESRRLSARRWILFFACRLPTRLPRPATGRPTSRLSATWRSYPLLARGPRFNEGCHSAPISIGINSSGIQLKRLDSGSRPE